MTPHAVFLSTVVSELVPLAVELSMLEQGVFADEGNVLLRTCDVNESPIGAAGLGVNEL